MKSSFKETAPLQSRAPRTRVHAVRIIAGRWKRTALGVADIPGLRPTPDRVRETLFNWLCHLNAGSLEQLSVLDLFAGTGALGFEAASRGAKHVLMVENAPGALQMLKTSRDRLAATEIEIWQADAREALRMLLERVERFDVIFLDPPFHLGWLERIGALSAQLLAPEGLLYVETEARFDPALFGISHFEVVRADKAGQVFYHLLRRKIGDNPREISPC